MAMINTQTTEQNIYEILVPKPRLNTLSVYIDGERDKTHDVARYAAYGAKMVGYATWKTISLGFKALDFAIEASNK